MTLPASGPLSLFQIADEFGLAHTAAFPSGFYGKGGAPSSGAISFTDFYGRSGAAATTFTPDGGTVTDEGDSQIVARLSCNYPATWTWSLTSGAGTASVTSGSASGYIDFTVTASGSGGKTFTRSGKWSVTGSYGGVSRNFTVNLTADGSNTA